ncbi:MAG TPA: Gfo/Idh/MocA family oxidoreductase, partial [Terriglobales bacterium]|nr:Gfo/Idh/MocA family oxidoreductase [Terriglobales bacterium]
MPQKLRFGIAGFGRHAVKRLMPGFASAKSSTVVTALTRRDAKAAAASAREFGIPHAFSSTAEMCRSEEVDAIFVASPDALHLADVLTAFSHGKHVLCEKPMAMNADECRQMIAAAKKAKRLLGVAHIFRFAHSVQHAQSQVAAGRLGEVSQARAEFHYWNEGHGRSWINDPGLACGGPIADVGVHCIDTLRFILQDEVIGVSATARSDAKSQPMEVSAIMTLEFVKGTLAEVAVSTRAHYRTALELVGAEGVVSAENGLSVESPVEIRFRATPSGKANTQTFSNGDAFTLQANAF